MTKPDIRPLLTLVVITLLGLSTFPQGIVRIGNNTGRSFAARIKDDLTVNDRAAIQELDRVFVNGWLKDDKRAVLSVFASDAVLLPQASDPVIGLKNIDAYWFPNDGSVTKITGFDRKIDEIEGNTKLAFLRGTASLSWTYEKDGKKTAQTSRSIDLLILARNSAGRWQVIRQMWTALPS